MSHASHEIARAVDDLQARYVRALDTRDLRGWLDTFRREPETAYFCISAENVERDLPIALMYDDCRDRIEDRVVFIEKIWAGTFQDYRTRHFIQRLHVEQDPSGLVRLETNFTILFTPETGRTEVQVAGLYRDEVVIDDEGARFRSKRAIYDTTILPRYIVYPF